MSVSTKEAVDSIIKEFQREFGLLDEIEKPVEEISSIGALEEISSAIEEFISNLQELVDDTTIRIEAIENFEEDNPEE